MESTSSRYNCSVQDPAVYWKLFEGRIKVEQMWINQADGINQWSYWKLMLSKTYILAQENSALIFKVAKDKIVLLLCSNMNGDLMVKPLMICMISVLSAFTFRNALGHPHKVHIKDTFLPFYKTELLQTTDQRIILLQIVFIRHMFRIV